MFAQLVALALAGSPEVVTLEVGAEPVVELSAVHGDITVRREGSGAVRMEAELPPKGDYADAWTFETRVDGDRVKAKVCCGKCNKGGMDVGRRNCSEGPIKVTAVMPERATFELSCVSAKVKVAGGTGDLRVSTVSGPVDITRTAGKLEISAVSSNVKVFPDEVRDTSVSTVSGDVHLTLPTSADADVRFSTLSGDGPRRSRAGRANGAEVAVSTVSGDLRVRGATED